MRHDSMRPSSPWATLIAALCLLVATTLAPPNARADDGAWVPLGPPPSNPIVYDSAQDRVLLIASNASVYEFRFSLGEWAPLATTGSASFCCGVSAIYDPVRNRVVVFEGTTPRIYELSLGATPAWTQLLGGAGGPFPRSSASAIFDPIRDRMLIYGGIQATGHPSGACVDVWAVDLDAPAWELITTAGPTPPGRGGHGAIYDPVRDRMVVYAGNETPGLGKSDAWALALGGTPTWSQIVPSGLIPAARSAPVTVYDPDSDCMIMTQGLALSGLGSALDIWALSLGGTPGWTELAGDAPVGWSMGLYDPVRERLVLKGASAVGGTGPVLSTWAIDLPSTDVTLLSPYVEPPALYEAQASYDAARDRMLVLGQGSGPQMWSLSLGATPQWSPVILGALPRSGHAQVFDPIGDRIVVFGGDGGSTGLSNEVHAFTTGDIDWEQITPAGTPPLPRYGATAIYDVPRERIILFGGYNPNTFDGYLDDVWALDLSGPPAWTQLGTLGTPPPGRRDHVAIYDPVRDRMVVFGGLAEQTAYDREVWTLDLAGAPTWHYVGILGAVPRGRANASGIYDSVNDALVVFGGAISPSLTDHDAWRLSLAGTPAWTQLLPTGPSPTDVAQSSAVYDPGDTRMVIHSPYFGTPKTWAIDFPPAPLPPVSVPPVATSDFAISSVLIAGSHAMPMVSLRLGGTSPARLRVFDIQGRAAVTRAIDGLGAGSHRVSVPELAGLPSGVYAMRLEQAGRVASARAVIAR